MTNVTNPHRESNAGVILGTCRWNHIHDLIGEGYFDPCGGEFPREAYKYDRVNRMPWRPWRDTATLAGLAAWHVWGML